MLAALGAHFLFFAFFRGEVAPLPNPCTEALIKTKQKQKEPLPPLPSVQASVLQGLLKDPVESFQSRRCD